MDRLRRLREFAQVARAGSFTAAAQRFAISRWPGSKQVAWLAHKLGAQLLVIRVGMPPSFGVHQLLRLALRFTALHPGIQIALPAPTPHP